MPSRSEQLKLVALGIVGEYGLITPEALMNRLRTEVGASQGEAFKTLAELIRDGRVRRSAFGELSLPGQGSGGGGGGYSTFQKIVVVVGLGGILVFMAWVFMNMLILRGVL